MAWLTADQRAAMGFAALGENVLLSDKASFYNCARIRIGSQIHVAVFTSLIGAGRISLGDFANVSSRVAIYSSSDDFSGHAMTNPMVPTEFTNVCTNPDELGRHVVIGTGAVILPGAVLEEGVAVGSMSMVNRRCEAFGIYAGIPARRIAERSRDLLMIEQKFRAALRPD